MKATLERRPIAGMDNAERIVVDCPHGTSEGVVVNVAGFDADVLIGLVVLKHFSEEGCSCTEALRARYSGVSRN